MNNKKIFKRALAVILCVALSVSLYIPMKPTAETAYSHNATSFTETELKDNWVAHRYSGGTLSSVSYDDAFNKTKDPYWYPNHSGEGKIDLQGNTCEGFTQDGSYSSLTLNKKLSKNMELNVTLSASDYQYKQSVAIGMAEAGEVNSDSTISITTAHGKSSNKRYKSVATITGASLVGGTRTLAFHQASGEEINLKLITYNDVLYVYNNDKIIEKLALNSKYTGGYAGLVSYNAYGIYSDFSVKELTEFEYNGPEYLSSLANTAEMYADGWVESYSKDPQSGEAFKEVTYDNGYRNFGNDGGAGYLQRADNNDWANGDVYSNKNNFSNNPFFNTAALTYSKEQFKYFKLEIDYMVGEKGCPYPIVSFGQPNNKTASLFYKTTKQYSSPTGYDDNVIGVYPQNNGAVTIAGKKAFEIRRFPAQDGKTTMRSMTITVLPDGIVADFKDGNTMFTELDDSYTGGYISLMFGPAYMRFRNISITKYEESELSATKHNIGDLYADSKIATLGRADYVEGTGYIMDNPMSGFEFTGDISGTVAINASKTKSDTRLYVEVDGVAKYVPIKVGSDRHIVLATGLKSGKHTIKVYNDLSQNFGELTVNSLEFEGTLDTITKDTSKVSILALGDSITAGADIEWNENHVNSSHASKSYAKLVADNLNANIDIVAVEGNDIVDINNKKNYISPRADSPEFDFTKDKRDVVLINLGTNDTWTIKDANSGWTDEQIGNEIATRVNTIITDVRAKYKDAYIIWIHNMLSDKWEDIYQKAVKSFNDAGDSKVLLIKAIYNKDGWSHPNEQAHKDNATLITDFINKKCYKLKGYDYLSSLESETEMKEDGWVESYSTDPQNNVAFTEVISDVGFRDIKNEGGIIRDNTSSGMGDFSNDWAQPYKNLTALTYSKQKFTYFKLEVDYKIGWPGNPWPIVSFGQQDSKVASMYYEVIDSEYAVANPTGDANAIGVHPSATGGLTIAGKNVIQMKANAYPGTEFPNSDDSRATWRHLTITVEPNSVTAQIDDKTPIVTTLSDSYKGGYVALMLGNSYSVFKNFKINELTDKQLEYTKSDFRSEYNNGKILPIGRADFTGRDFVMDNSMSGFEIKGDLSGDIKLTNVKTNRDGYTTKLLVEIDGVASYVDLPVGENETVIATGLASGKHTIRVMNGYSQNFGNITVTGIEYTGTLDKISKNQNMINMLALGDSITAGYGVYQSGNDLTTTDSSKSYAYLTAKKLNAYIDIVAAEGNTIEDLYWKKDLVSNRHGALPYSYESIAEDMDVIIVNLGTNDESRLKTTYSSLSGTEKWTAISNDIYNRADMMIKDLRAKCPESYIIWVYDMMGTNFKGEYASLNPYEKIVKAYNDAGDDKVLAFDAETNTDGYASHPTAAAHEGYAEALAEFIEENCEIAPAIGDLNEDNSVNDKDVIYLCKSLKNSGSYPLNQSCDFNDDGAVNEKDAAYLLYYIFLPERYPIEQK